MFFDSPSSSLVTRTRSVNPPAEVGRPSITFMCREALKGYLEKQLPSEAKAALEQFVDEHNPAGVRDAEATLDALRRIKVCDPACGSGAYLLGMLHELLDLRAALFVTKRVDAVSVYERKLEIIQRNFYGVDIDPFAINMLVRLCARKERSRTLIWPFMSSSFAAPKRIRSSRRT